MVRIQIAIFAALAAANVLAQDAPLPPTTDSLAGAPGAIIDTPSPQAPNCGLTVRPRLSRSDAVAFLGAATGKRTRIQ